MDKRSQVKVMLELHYILHGLEGDSCRYGDNERVLVDHRCHFSQNLVDNVRLHCYYHNFIVLHDLQIVSGCLHAKLLLP